MPKRIVFTDGDGTDLEVFPPNDGILQLCIIRREPHEQFYEHVNLIKSDVKELIKVLTELESAMLE